MFSQRLEEPRRPECSGSPLPGVNIRLVDDTGREVNGIGELEVRSPQMFSGYHRKDDLDMVAFHHGWFQTGDMAMFDNGRTGFSDGAT